MCNVFLKYMNLVAHQVFRLFITFQTQNLSGENIALFANMINRSSSIVPKFKLQLSFTIRLVQSGVHGHREHGNRSHQNVENGQHEEGCFSCTRTQRWELHKLRMHREHGLHLQGDRSSARRVHSSSFSSSLRHFARVSRCFLREVMCSGVAFTGL